MPAPLADHRDHLLEEEWVAAGRGEYAGLGLLRKVEVGRQGVEERLTVLRGERLEVDRGRVQLAAAPARSLLEQIRSSHAEKKDRGVARPVGDVLEQIEEDGLGPLDVVEHDDLRSIGGAGLEQLPERKLRLGRRFADHGVRLDADREQDLDQRPVGDVLAVVQAAGAQNVGGLVRAREELRDEPGLTGAGGSQQREQVAGARRHNSLEVGQEPVPLTHPSDERRVEMPRERIRRQVHSKQLESRDPLALPLELQRLDGLHRHGIPHERERLGADQDLARRRGLLEPRRNVHCITGGECLPLAGHHLARVDARAEGQRHRQLLAQRPELLADLRRRAHRAQRVVLVRDRDAEHCHHRITDELLHGAAVPLDDHPDLLEVAAHRPPHRLWVEPLAERRRAGDVAEDDGHRLANLAPSGRRRQLGRAGAAEAKPLRVLLAAVRADRHQLRLVPAGADYNRLRGAERALGVSVDPIEEGALSAQTKKRCPEPCPELRKSDRTERTSEHLTEPNTPESRPFRGTSNPRAEVRLLPGPFGTSL